MGRVLARDLKKYDSAAQFEIVRAHGLTAPHNNLSAGNVLFITQGEGFCSACTFMMP